MPTCARGYTYCSREIRLSGAYRHNLTRLEAAERTHGCWSWTRALGRNVRGVSTRPQLECLSTMAALAGATKRIKFGMNVASLGWREPVLLAKQCATIDVVSEGRLLSAFGVDSPGAQEWQVLGVPEEGRGARTDEALEIMSRLWTGETVDFRWDSLPTRFCAHRPDSSAEKVSAVDWRI